MARRKRSIPLARRAATRPRDAAGHFLSKGSIAALKGWDTRRAKQRAKVRAVQKRVKAAVHGKAARERTEARLTEAQRAARRRDAGRIEQKVRRRKKPLLTPPAAAPSSARYVSSPRNRKRTSGSKRKRRRTSKATRTRERSFSFDAGGSGDELKVQIGVRFNMEKEPSNRLAYEAILHRIDRDDNAPRTQTRIIRWKNPGRKSGELREWRQGNQDDAWVTLGPPIRAAILRAYPDMELTV